MPVERIKLFHSRRGMRRLRRFALLLLIAALLAATAFSLHIRPLIVNMADSGVADLITVCVDRSVNALMDDGFPEYGELIQLVTDETGRVTALVTNMMTVNRMKAYVTSAVLESLEELEYTEIYIPLGSIIGGALFMGRGPRIPITLLSCTNITTYFSSEFQAAGINQTRHSILLHVDVSLDILVAGGTVSSMVANQISVADTVIVGLVPETYASLE